MPSIAQAAYRGTQYSSYGQAKWSFRPVAGATYLPGQVLQLVAQDAQVYPDEATAQPSPAGTTLQKLCGVVSAEWPGFNGSIGAPSYSAPSLPASEYGTTYVEAIVKGYVPGIYVDQTGTGAVTLVDGLPLVSSRSTAGYAQGVATASAPGGAAVIALAALPAAGIGSSITAASLAQASATDTLTGTPAAGDTLSVTIQAPYSSGQPGVVQTITYTTPPLTSAQAAPVTTAAQALVAYLNGIPSFSTYFVASNAAGVVTVTVNALATPFRVNTAGGIGSPSFSVEGSSYSISLSGMVSNSLTFSVSSTGGTTSTASGANFSGGTGFKGMIPAWVCSSL